MPHRAPTPPRLLAACAALLWAMLPLQAAAREIVVTVHPVVQVLQAQDESGDAFVARAARTMRDYTERTSFEAGGWLCLHPGTGQRAVSVISSHSQINVAAGIKGCPLGGYQPTQEFMHSHPVRDSIVLTAQDLAGYPAGTVARVFRGMTAGARVRVGASGGRFSAADMELGPGYLVHGDHLYYQKDGRQQWVRNLQAEDDAGPQHGVAAAR